MNWKSIYQKPAAGIAWTIKGIYKSIAWVLKKIYGAIKWVVVSLINFIKWDIKQAKSLTKGTWNLIVKIYSWIESVLVKMGRFWIGIAMMLYGAKVASTSGPAFVAFLNHTLTPEMANGHFAHGLAVMLIGLICVIASADYSKLTTFIKK